MKHMTLYYKGYYTIPQFNEEDGVFFGRVEGIRDLVNYESAAQADIEHEFRLAVDDYLSFCEDIGQKPDAPNAFTLSYGLTDESLFSHGQKCTMNSGKKWLGKENTVFNVSFDGGSAA